jgi:hypothetical protein
MSEPKPAHLAPARHCKSSLRFPSRNELSKKKKEKKKRTKEQKQMTDYGAQSPAPPLHPSLCVNLKRPGTLLLFSSLFSLLFLFLFVLFFFFFILVYHALDVCFFLSLASPAAYRHCGLAETSPHCR